MCPCHGLMVLGLFVFVLLVSCVALLFSPFGHLVFALSSYLSCFLERLLDYWSASSSVFLGSFIQRQFGSCWVVECFLGFSLLCVSLLCSSLLLCSCAPPLTCPASPSSALPCSQCLPQQSCQQTNQSKTLFQLWNVIKQKISYIIHVLVGIFTSILLMQVAFVLCCHGFPGSYFGNQSCKKCVYALTFCVN